MGIVRCYWKLLGITGYYKELVVIIGILEISVHNFTQWFTY